MSKPSKQQISEANKRHREYKRQWMWNKRHGIVKAIHAGKKCKNCMEVEIPTRKLLCDECRHLRLLKYQRDHYFKKIGGVYKRPERILSARTKVSYLPKQCARCEGRIRATDTLDPTMCDWCVKELSKQQVTA